MYTNGSDLHKNDPDITNLELFCVFLEYRPAYWMRVTFSYKVESIDLHCLGLLEDDQVFFVIFYKICKHNSKAIHLIGLMLLQ